MLMQKNLCQDAKRHRPLNPRSINPSHHTLKPSRRSMTPLRRVLPTLTNHIRPMSRLPLVSTSTLCNNQRRTFFGNSGGGNNEGPYVVPTPVNIGFCVVPQQTAYVIERLGKYSMVSFPVCLVHTDCARVSLTFFCLPSSTSIHLPPPPFPPQK